MGDWIGAAPTLWAKKTPRGPPAGPLAGSGQAAGGGGGAAKHGDGDEEELYSDDPVRNRQKELQDLIVSAEDADAILTTVRELDGAIVISTALHRLGKVGIVGETHKDPRFAVLLEKFRQRLPFFGARQLSNSLHGLGALFYREQGPWVAMVNIQIQRRIRDFEPQHVSNTLWACARMQLKEDLMLKALLSRAIDDIGRSCPLDISIVTWAIATLKYKDKAWLHAVVRARLDFADFSPQNMSNFVWGLATLSFKNDNMVLAVGREAARKIQDFIPQELSNFTWALATLDLCDNLWLRAVGDEVERRGDEVNTWDPQSLSNMMWAFATLAVKDDFLMQRLLKASVARIKDHDSQNLANSSWAAAMVLFRFTEWLDAAANATVSNIEEADTLHLAQLAFAYSRFTYPATQFAFVPALLREALRRTEEFAPQSLLDVHDALVFFGVRGPPLPPTHIERRISCFYDDLVARVEAFAVLSAKGRPTTDQVMAYQKDIEQRDIVSLGKHYSEDFLRRFGLLCPSEDPFVSNGRQQVRAYRAQAVAKDPTSRSGFHRAQCAWQLGIKGDTDAIADGLYESGAPQDGGPSQHGLVVCRLRHPRDGDAEVQALCAALGTSLLRRGPGALPNGLALNLHLSDVPCVSCLGATLQFHMRFPGVLRVSFDRGREAEVDTIPCARPPPPPSKKGNLYPYAPESLTRRDKGEGEDGEEPVDRSLVRKEGPDCRDTEGSSFYGSRGPRRANGAAMGGNEAVPHKVLAKATGGSAQTYYFSSRPEFFGSSQYQGLPQL